VTQPENPTYFCAATPTNVVGPVACTRISALPLRHSPSIGSAACAGTAASAVVAKKAALIPWHRRAPRMARRYVQTPFNHSS
jgi:hypothetical protein